jgi:hypothetical protein
VLVQQVAEFEQRRHVRNGFAAQVNDHNGAG